jgi:hypothetical protein
MEAGSWKGVEHVAHWLRLPAGLVWQEHFGGNRRRYEGRIFPNSREMFRFSSDYSFTKMLE